MNELEESWRVQCARQIRLQDDGLRSALYKSLVAPNLRRLRGGNGTAWGQPGWYAATGEAVAAPLAPPSPFPVPLECTAWHNLELDQANGRVHRFFDRRAWLHIAYRRGAQGLSFIVPHVVMPEALATLCVRLFGSEQAYHIEPHAGTHGRVIVGFDEGTLAACNRLGRVELELECGIVAIPALAYPGSTDRRRLSVAVTAPQLFD